ncbi:DNA-3-methyladenine glycosylase family protein [Runella sp.]|uniref:DNA-3-methyladenine glycosylase family protein n=1 Tax=Runella sp. TaxID=1960881 RepID=UPI003D143662
MIPEIYLASKDAVLASIIETTPTLKTTDWNNDVYLALLESIVSQQISTKAADSIFARFRALFDDSYPHPELLIGKTIEELRGAGLSFQKINYLQNVAVFAIEKGIDYHQLSNMTDDEIVAYLIPIKGVGRWTVEMLLMFVMERPDVFPIDDLVIRQKMVRAYNLTETGRVLYKELHVIAENWRPYRTMACRYLWRWKPEL